MRTVVVTGGGRGIGRAIALAFADSSSHIVVAGRTRSALDATADEIRQSGAHATAVVLDVSDRESVAAGVVRDSPQCRGHRCPYQQRRHRRRRTGSGIGHRSLAASTGRQSLRHVPRHPGMLAADA